MTMLLGVLAGWGMLMLAAPEAESGVPGQDVHASGGRAVATAPAENPASLVPGPLNRRQTEGQGRRNPGPGGSPGPGGAALRRPGLRPGMSPDEPVTLEQTRQIMDFARENFPQLYDRLERLRQHDLQKFAQVLHDTRGRLLPILEASRRDPEVAKKMIAEQRLQLAINELAEKYRQTRSDAERAQLGAEVQAKVRERFEMFQSRMRMEIERLRKRLDEQEKKLADREQKKEEMVRGEMERLLRPAGGRDRAGGKTATSKP
jgi:hypothetical protein